jgi:hypothetical protein
MDGGQAGGLLHFGRRRHHARVGGNLILCVANDWNDGNDWNVDIPYSSYSYSKQCSVVKKIK